MRTTAVLSTVVLGAALLAGCGNSGTNSGAGKAAGGYCQQLKAASTDFASLSSSSPDFTKLSKAIETFHRLAGSAPEAVADDWKTLDGGFAVLRNDLAAAGLSLRQLGPLTKGQLPPGMTPAQLSALGPKLQATFAKLDDPKFKQAGTAIEKHAKTVCHVDLAKG